MVHGTLTSAFWSLVDQGVIEFNNINKFVKGNIFATDADIQSGTAGDWKSRSRHSIKRFV